MEKQDIIPTLRKHLLVDGFDDIVVDLKKSQGSWIHDALTGKKILDFFSFFASAPIGFNYPEIMKKDFQKERWCSLFPISLGDFLKLEEAQDRRKINPIWPKQVNVFWYRPILSFLDFPWPEELPFSLCLVCNF